MSDETNVEEVEVEELAANEIDDELGVDEEESGEETEVEDSADIQPADEDGGDNEANPDRQARQDRAKAQIERLKEENKRLKEDKRKKEREVSPTNSDLVAKAYLASAFDIKEASAQEEALRLADKMDMSVDELMEDPDYNARVSMFQKRIVQNRKVAANTGGAAQRKKTAEYAAKYFEKNSSFPANTPQDVKSKAIDIINGTTPQHWQ